MRSDLFKKSALLGLLLLPALSIAADKPIPPAKPETPVVAAADKEPIYGYQLMTEQERATFRTQMQAATTDEERQQIRLQHREQMLERAKAQGITLPEPPAVAPGEQPVFGGRMMTNEEQMRFRTQMQNATTDEERQQIRLQHREQMLERAKAQGVTLSDPPAITPGDEVVFGGQMMTMEERLQFRTQMQNATTDEERQQIRLQHREQMLERAKAQGVTLSDMPMMNGQGMGKGMGMGMGGGTGSGSSSGSSSGSGSGSSSSGSSSGQGSSGSSSGGGNSGGGSGNSGGGGGK